MTLLHCHSSKSIFLHGWVKAHKTCEEETNYSDLQWGKGRAHGGQKIILPVPLSYRKTSPELESTRGTEKAREGITNDDD